MTATRISETSEGAARLTQPVDPRLVEALHSQLDERRRVIARRSARRIGWKLAYGIASVKKVAGDRPALGYLTSASMLAPGATWKVAATRGLRAETELAVEVGHVIWPDDDDAIVLSAVAGLATALELVDVGEDQTNFHEVLRGNVLHRAFAVGERRAYERLPGRVATLRVNGDIRERVGSATDIAAGLRQTAQLLDSMGERLLPGDLVLMGSLTHVPVEPGDLVVADIEGLGAFSIRLAEPSALRG